MRIGVLTGGGDCPGLNAVIRAVTKSLLLKCDATVIGFEEGFLGMIEGRSRELDLKALKGILARGGTILGTHNKANPFNHYLADGADVSDQLVENYHRLKLDGVVVIGGDGTMSIAHRLSEKGVKCVGVPKTIDNDLMHTDRTFGFDTAVAVATEAVDRLQTTGESHSRVMILETMGRYAGWLALHSGLAGGADVILIPELPFDVEEIARVCQQRKKRQRFTMIVVAEGATLLDGKQVVRERIDDSPDPLRLGGIGNLLAEQLKPLVDSEIRTTTLGHIQRGGTPTAFDRVLSTAFGAHAAALVAGGRWGRMVALQKGQMTSVEIAEVADQTRLVPVDSLLVHAAAAVGTSFGRADFEVDLSRMPENRVI
ncbi:ATP-dependent 6-phosphofructokinase [Lujinxingia vulgaris]|uniref:ATP-dependent 6-phosphofructokinase n=1 Tax=Lujinxingia vulgaris TaxID=2600176 RepID=A0A5C6WYR0_9DELT|nr:ATP-dependent 6-phosphofructokinase [Lujinxingia vulgaris]TXD34652.1 ATP-dependent 6-phosphofructokinase [Lujinxingia vulgaris]